ncbi:hypothetical protein B0H14DRAFT_3864393 [Mycena olivaceomarginata]|nr:hypothetical protein B0H14DRAFT_3864393 [Mycena olivaceomarginata]
MERGGDLIKKYTTQAVRHMGLLVPVEGVRAEIQSLGQFFPMELDLTVLSPPLSTCPLPPLLTSSPNFPRRPDYHHRQFSPYSEIPHAGPCLRAEGAVNHRPRPTKPFCSPPRLTPSLAPFTHAHAPRATSNPVPARPPRTDTLPPARFLARALRAACTLRPVRHPPRRCPAAPSPHATSPWRRLPLTTRPPRHLRIHVASPPSTASACLHTPCCFRSAARFLRAYRQLASLATTSMSPMLTPPFPCARPTARPIPPASLHPVSTRGYLPLVLIHRVHRCCPPNSVLAILAVLVDVPAPSSSLPARCATAHRISVVPVRPSPLRAPRSRVSISASVLPRSFRPPTLPRCASVAPCHTLPRPYRPASALPPSRLPTPASASPHDHTAVASPEYPCRLPAATSAPSLLPPRCATSALAHVCTHPLLSARSRAIPRRPSNTPRRRVRCA